MAEPPKTPTKATTRVCRTYNENIVVKNHPLDLFGAKASQENIPSVLERFFELKVALTHGLPSYSISVDVTIKRFRGNNKSQFHVSKEGKQRLRVHREDPRKREVT